jgi:hypothetical protein
MGVSHSQATLCAGNDIGESVTLISFPDRGYDHGAAFIPAFSIKSSLCIHLSNVLSSSYPRHAVLLEIISRTWSPRESVQGKCVS